jgi:hypothetical protein
VLRDILFGHHLPIAARTTLRRVFPGSVGLRLLDSVYLRAASCALAAALVFVGGPAVAQERGVQDVRRNGGRMVNKDFGSERWAITRHPSGFITGNVFRLEGGPPSFVVCRPNGEVNRFRCEGGNGCPQDSSGAGADRGTSRPPLDGLLLGELVLVNKDVGSERWAITRHTDRRISGNVFDEDGGPPLFVWCAPLEERDNYRCFGADACTGEPCGYSYRLIADVVLPSTFFEQPAACADEYRLIGENVEIPPEFFEVVNPVTRLVDNDDGTITDLQTGLQWEKKETELGSGADYSNPHDVDNRYSWSADYAAPDGTVFTQFLATLNTPPCFAGHCDWRLPTSGRGDGDPPAELESLLLEPYFCVAPPGQECIAPIFGPTWLEYWSASDTERSPPNAWVVSFTNGEVRLLGKVYDSAARAVRGPILPAGGATQAHSPAGETAPAATPQN